MGVERLLCGARHNSSQSNRVRQAKDTKPDREERSRSQDTHRSTEARGTRTSVMVTQFSRTEVVTTEHKRSQSLP